MKKLIVLSLFIAMLGIMVGCGNNPTPKPSPSPSPTATNSIYPNNRPDLEPYGAADISPELMINDTNSKILNLELRPQDQALGRVWIRDTYVTYINGTYYLIGTTKVADQPDAKLWNDGLYVWTSTSLDGQWKLIDTTSIDPAKPKGQVWCQGDYNKDDLTTWQGYRKNITVTEKDDAGNIIGPVTYEKLGVVWAPEIHYIKGNWYIVACMGDSNLENRGSFILVSTSGKPEGPYVNIDGNKTKPLGYAADSWYKTQGAHGIFGNYTYQEAGSTVTVSTGKTYHIDGSLFEDSNGDVYFVVHNNFYGKMSINESNQLSDTSITSTPFSQTKYSGEPYLEGAFIFKYGNKYHLIQAVFSGKLVKTTDPTLPLYKYATNAQFNPTHANYAYDRYSYDCIISSADSFNGQYGKRYTAGVGIGHNNLFADKDGKIWATFFKNPVSQQYKDDPNSAVPGIIEMQWTGPDGNRFYVKH